MTSQQNNTPAGDKPLPNIQYLEDNHACVQTVKELMLRQAENPELDYSLAIWILIGHMAEQPH